MSSGVSDQVNAAAAAAAGASDGGGDDKRNTRKNLKIYIIRHFCTIINNFTNNC